MSKKRNQGGSRDDPEKEQNWFYFRERVVFSADACGIGTESEFVAWSSAVSDMLGRVLDCSQEIPADTAFLGERDCLACMDRRVYTDPVCDVASGSSRTGR